MKKNLPIYLTMTALLLANLFICIQVINLGSESITIQQYALSVLPTCLFMMVVEIIGCRRKNHEE